MRGIESTAGVDKLATTKVMNTETISVSFFMAVFGHKRGSLTARERNPSVCPSCGEEPEDEELMLWRCPRWETLRLEKQAPSNRGRLTWPPCTSKCGTFLEDPESVAWAHRGPSACAQSIRCDTLPDNVLSDARFERETKNDDTVVAWTDGAEQVAGCSPARPITGTALSPCLDVSRLTTVLNCWPSLRR